MGYHIARRLLQNGHEVILFNRGKTNDDFGDKIHRIHGDRYDYPLFQKMFKKDRFDVVIDMIAFKAEDSEAAVKTFLDKVSHFFHISTAAVYLLTRDYPCPLQERDFDRPLYPRLKEDNGWWSYGYHKRKCEEVLSQAHKKSGFPVTALRLPIIMGERDYTLRAYSYFLRIQDGKPLILPDSGQNAFTHIYQDDIVQTVTANLLNETAYGQIYNLAQEEVLTLKLFVQKAAEIMERKVEMVDIPSDVLQKLGLGTSFSPFSMRRPFILDVRKAKEELGFSSTPFAVWLRRTIHWFNQEYHGGPSKDYRTRQKEIEVIQKYREAIHKIKD